MSYTCKNFGNFIFYLPLVPVGMKVLKRNLRTETRKGGKMESKRTGPYKLGQWFLTFFSACTPFTPVTSCTPWLLKYKKKDVLRYPCPSLICLNHMLYMYHVLKSITRLPLHQEVRCRLISISTVLRFFFRKITSTYNSVFCVNYLYASLHPQGVQAPLVKYHCNRDCIFVCPIFLSFRFL